MINPVKKITKNLVKDKHSYEKLFGNFSVQRPRKVSLDR